MSIRTKIKYRIVLYSKNGEVGSRVFNFVKNMKEKYNVLFEEMADGILKVKEIVAGERTYRCFKIRNRSCILQVRMDIN